MSIFIQGISQISIQEPLSEKWLDMPVIPHTIMPPSIDPDFGKYFSPMESRRMGVLIKRAVATSMDVMQKTGLNVPDAIIAGTGIGCIEPTEKLLNALIENDEECIPPAAFSQSTHNTIAAQMALKLNCHGYNCTYAHRGTSFDSALFDAFLQFKLKKIESALVGSYDTMSENYFLLLGKLNYWKSDFCGIQQLRHSKSSGSISGNCSLSMLLSSHPSPNSFCELKDVEMFYRPTILQIKHNLNAILLRNELILSDVDAVVMGWSGDRDNDDVYYELKEHCFKDVPLLWYKQLFGESFSASAFGTYVASVCLREGRIPEHLFFFPEDFEKVKNKPRNILVYNHFRDRDHSLILLSK